MRAALVIGGIVRALGVCGMVRTLGVGGIVGALAVGCIGYALGVATLSAQESQPSTVAAQADPEAIGVRPPPISVFGYPVLDVDQDQIIWLLKAGRFAELEERLQALETATRRDITREVELDASYRSFFGSDATIRARLDEWVGSDPQSDAALIARAQFHAARSWEARGERLAIDDPGAVRRSRAAGIGDARRALELDPDNLAAYSTALAVRATAGWSAATAELVNAGLARFPTSYWIRWQAAGLMEPRWGGSYELMNELADGAQPYANANPRLAPLRGAAILEEASSLRLARRYDAALEKLEEAREYGTDWSFYYQRGRTLFHANRLVEALAALDSAVAIRPVSHNVLHYRGWTLYWSGRRIGAPDQRGQYFTHAAIDVVEAAKRSQADPDLSELLHRATVLRASCTESPLDCLEAVEAENSSPGQFDGPWWARILVFIVSLPVTLWMIFVDGQRMHLLPAPLIGAATFLWSFREWRRQRYWTPRLIHVMSVLALATIVLINVDWVRTGGEMWTQRYVVIAIFGLFPYVTYLVFLGPKFLGRRASPREAEWGSDEPFD